VRAVISCDDPTILALTPYNFYGGEICKVVATIHCINTQR
jgi:hypothetical protein